MKSYPDKELRVLIFDDEENTRKSAARRFKRDGIQVAECETVEEFRDAWLAGMFDAVVADWQLSETYHGEQVLKEVRNTDWIVPFVLISGRLEQDGLKTGVFKEMIEAGFCRFIQRGDSAIEDLYSAVMDLINKRDMSLVKIISNLRKAAESNVKIKTSSGEVSAAEILAGVVKDVNESIIAGEPLAELSLEKFLGEQD